MSKLIGTRPDQIPTNGDLGSLAYQDGDNLKVEGGSATGLTEFGLGDATVSDVIADLPIQRPGMSFNFAGSHTHSAALKGQGSRFYCDGLSRQVYESNTYAWSTDLTKGSDYWGLGNATVQKSLVDAPPLDFSEELVTRLYESTDNTEHTIYAGPASNALVRKNQWMVTSIYMKAGTQNYGAIRIWKQAGETASCTFDLTNGTVGSFDNNGDIVSISTANSGVVSVGNGWYRCYVTWRYSPNASTSTGEFLAFNPAFNTSNSATPTYENNGGPEYTGSTSNYILLWGPQTEYVSEYTRGPGPYCPTYGQAVMIDGLKLKTPDRWNSLRVNHDPKTGECLGLLCEGISTNYVNHVSPYYGNNPSHEFLCQSPDGSRRAVAPVPNAEADRFQHGLSAGQFPNNTPFVISWYARKLTTGNSSYERFGGLSPNSWVGAVEDSGIIEIEDFGNGWKRYYMRGHISDNSATQYIRMYFGGYIGINKTGYAYWGHQLEMNRNYPTSLIASGGSSTALADFPVLDKDLAGVDYINHTNGFTHSQGTIVGDIDINQGNVRIGTGADARRHIFSLRTAGINHGWLTAYYDDVSTSFVVLRYQNGVNNYTTYQAKNITGRSRFAVSWDNENNNNILKICIDGLDVETNTEGFPGVGHDGFRNLELGHGANNGTRTLDGHIKNMSFYTGVMSDAELKALTSI